MKRYVLDTSAMLAFLEDRPGAAMVEELFGKAVESHRLLAMSVVSWGMLFQIIMTAQNEASALSKMNELQHLPIELVRVDEAMCLLAASISSKCGLPYSECFPIALAQSRKSILVSANRERKLPSNVKVLIAET